MEGQFYGEQFLRTRTSYFEKRICARMPPRESILAFEILVATVLCATLLSEGPMPKSSDPWSIVIIVLTIALFILALFVKGFTKGLLVECGVLMVSIKLILMAKKTAEIEQNLERRLDRIEKLLSEEKDGKAD